MDRTKYCQPTIASIFDHEPQ